MKKGDTVNYYDKNGKQHSAIVVDIAGHGPSVAKRLDLSYKVDGEETVVADVPYERDAKEKEAFWLKKGERRSSPEPEPDLVAFEPAAPKGKK